MAKDLAVITIHGMGSTKPDYYMKFEKKLRRAVGDDVWDNRIHLEPVYFQDLLQGNQEDYWEESNDEFGLRWDFLRKFMLFAFSDAASIEYSFHHDQTLYKSVHQKFAAACDTCFQELGQAAKPVFVIAQSLGGQQVSNYLWDAGRNTGLFAEPGQGTPEEQAFRRLSTCRQFITTGCNIPVFTAGLSTPQLFDRPNDNFTWHNYFDVDDVLGYPIRTMKGSYDVDWIIDHEVSVGGFFTGWNPISHVKYWTDRDVIQPIAEAINAILE